MGDMTANRTIRHYMQQKGLCAEELARRSGIEQSGLEQAIMELRPVYADELWRLASALDVSVEKLLFAE